MCSTSVNIEEINQRLSTPASCSYSASSPSSVAEMVRFRAHSDGTGSATRVPGLITSACVQECGSKFPSPAKTVSYSDQEARTQTSGDCAGDSSIPAEKDEKDSCPGKHGLINTDMSTALSTSSTLRKRRWSSVGDEKDEHSAAVKRVQLGDDQDVKPASPASMEDQLRSCSESVKGSPLDQSAETADDYDDDVCYSPAVDLDCSDARYSRRTLYIEYWSRTDECKERKWDHLDEIADKYGSAEEHIFATTLNGRTACLEPNMFPYNTPAGIEHWTLWHVQDLTHEQIKQYVENWIDANAPHVHRWNYDDNPERSIDIFHVHVYLQVGDEDSVLQGRKVEDLLHECD
jgi:hypothetical protein